MKIADTSFKVLQNCCINSFDDHIPINVSHIYAKPNTFFNDRGGGGLLISYRHIFSLCLTFLTEVMSHKIIQHNKFCLNKYLCIDNQVQDKEIMRKVFNQITTDDVFLKC